MGADIVDAEIVEEAGNLPAVTGGGDVVTVDVNATLTPAARKMLEESGRTGTRDAYFSVWTSFARWCATNDLGIAPKPASGD